MSRERERERERERQRDLKYVMPRNTTRHMAFFLKKIMRCMLVSNTESERERQRNRERQGERERES